MSYYYQMDLFGVSVFIYFFLINICFIIPIGGIDTSIAKISVPIIVIQALYEDSKKVQFPPSYK
jgi:hypothetical protein